jgi:hypothetical protein
MLEDRRVGGQDSKAKGGNPRRGNCRQRGMPQVPRSRSALDTLRGLA